MASATHDESDFPLIGAAVGATTLGISGLLTSPARSAIYLQAQTATLCAMSAYDVYFISEADYTTYLSDSTPFSRDIVAVNGARSALKAALDRYTEGTPAAVAEADLAATKAKKNPATTSAEKKTPGQQVEEAANSVTVAAKSLLKQAETDLAAAEATQKSLMGVRGRVDEAGRSLGARRMAIKAEVDQSLQTTELTIDQIKAAVSAAALASNQPTASPPAASDAKTGAPAAQAAENPSALREFAPKGRANDLWQKMQALEQALEQLQFHKIAPDNWLARALQKEREATQVATCSASARAVLTATPPNPAQVAKGKPLNIPIHAPSIGGAPSASKLADGLTAVMTATGPYDYTLVISEGDTASPAKAQTVVITSGAQSVTVPFTVTDGSDSGGGAGTSGGGGATGGDTPPPPPPTQKTAP
ncbi:hypothetical protein [Caulobacter segnis]|uniref:hypothetical protein n=1 Tax=Caulobacter segnis TaxID=88688 RepID=UPI0026EECCBF|nr:hypothetical protein [Caulobacter segnis]